MLIKKKFEKRKEKKKKNTYLRVEKKKS